jgi:hypothetical protein
MDFTGSRKYSGRSSEVRRVAAAGEIEARRAMPTSGATLLCVGPSSAKAATLRKSSRWIGSLHEEGKLGRQSEPPLSGTMLPEPVDGASALVRAFGLRSGQSGKREAEELAAGWRIGKPAVELEERTGDMAHLETNPLFRFLFAMSSSFVFYSREVENGQDF